MHRNLVRLPSLLLAAAFVLLVARPGLTQALKSGQAAGTFVVGDKTHKLVYATAFTDGRDESRPVVLLLTDVPVPENVLSGTVSINFSQTMSEKPFNGVVLRFNARGMIMRADYYEKDEQTSGTGELFDVKFDGPVGPTVIGSIKSTAAAAKQTPPMKLDATFSATLK